MQQPFGLSTTIDGQLADQPDREWRSGVEVKSTSLTAIPGGLSQTLCMEMKLKITDRESVNVSSPAELRDHLVRIREGVCDDRPTIVTVDDVHGHTLTVGIHPEYGWVQVAPASGLPPYMVTIGDDPGEGVRAYYLHSFHHTEIRVQHELPITDAIAAAVAFAETARLPARVNWGEI